MTNDTQQEQRASEQEATPSNAEVVPDWVKVFEDLQREAEEAYADGRVKIIIPKRKRKKPS